MSKFREKIARFRLFLSISKPMVLSHHPLCEKYDPHVYHVGKHKLCIGCFTFYPVVLITLILSFLYVDTSNLLSVMLLYFISLIFMSAVLLSVLNLTKYKVIKILSKVSVGIGVGFFIIATIYLPLPLFLKIIMFLQVSSFTGIIAYIRGKGMLEDCAECEYKGDWSVCPSMKPMIDKLIEHNFIKEKEIQDFRDTASKMVDS